MMILSAALVIAGIAVAGWGLVAAHRLRSPWDTVAALAVPVGVIAAIMGTLLLAVPGFFA